MRRVGLSASQAARLTRSVEGEPSYHLERPDGTWIDLSQKSSGRSLVLRDMSAGLQAAKYVATKLNETISLVQLKTDQAGIETRAVLATIAPTVPS